MPFPDFDKLQWKEFERLCADLLNAEGFDIESEPFVDRTGSDLIAIEEYRSHDPQRVIRVRWRVQCKHYATSNNHLGRKEVEEALNSYEITRKADEGLFLIVDTDYSEPAKEVIDKYVSAHPDAKVSLWNQRQLVARLERHPHLLNRYGLSIPKCDYLSLLAPLRRLGSVRTLLLSDQSAMAHNVASAFLAAAFDLTFLPFQNYLDPMRLQLLQQTVLQGEFRLVICFLGDSFNTPLTDEVVKVIERCYRRGTALLFFPFMAWSMNRGLYDSLNGIVPVKLQDPTASFSMKSAIEKVTGPYRRGDFRWLLFGDSFAEDQYTELDPAGGAAPFTDGITSRFGLSHSFEHLTVTDVSRLVWANTAGNPVVVVNEGGKGKVCYLNSCCHSCMTPFTISSPFEASSEFVLLFRNIIQWLLV